VQAAVTELLMDIQRKNKTTMLFISHDLSVVRYIADRVVVMYLGYIVEQGTTDQIFSPPYHPYTEALLSAIPIADTSVVKKHIVLEGDIPSAMNPPSGCPFQTRCRWKQFVPGNKCETEVPPVKHLGNGHMSLCWLDDDQLATMEPVISFKDEKSSPAKKRSAKRKPTKAAKTAEKPAAGAAATPATARKAGSAAKRRPSASVSALPGESSPKKIAGEAGGGREAASTRVTPATARTRKEEANATGTRGAQKRLVKTASSPAAARAAIGAKPGKAKSASGKTASADAGRPPAMKKPAKPDDLKKISGVGPKIEGILNDLGIYTYAQVASWKKAEREWVDGKLKFHGRIEREDWGKQARALAKGSKR
jgi:peptide/nickel transport system ATP-binding protein